MLRVTIVETGFLLIYRKGGLPFSNDSSADIYQVHEVQRVDLRLRNDVDMPSGIYLCIIATSVVHDDDNTPLRKSVYVGLYPSGGIYIG